MKILIIAGLATILGCHDLLATPKIEELVTSGRWTAYRMKEGNETYCYMHTTPTSSKGNYDKRGTVNLLITHFPHLKRHNVVEFQTGYPFHSKKESLAQIDGKKHILFTDGEGAWCADSISDKNLTENILRSSKSLVVKGVSRKGTETEDTYSLSGSLRAYQAICKACDVRSLLADFHPPVVQKQSPQKPPALKVISKKAPVKELKKVVKAAAKKPINIKKIAHGKTSQKKR